MTEPTPHPAAPAPQLKSAGREVEIKFLLSPATFREAQQWERLGPPTPRPRARRLHSIYFDTEDGDLRRHKAVLRVRSVHRRHILTFKWNGKFAGGAFERGEMEVPTTSENADPALLGSEIAQLIEAICNGRPLQPVYETDVMRTAYLLHHGASDVEVAFDKGRILAGAHACPICEIEMELKSGHPVDLYHLGMSLTEAFPVTLGCQSKSERAAALYAGAKPAIIHAPKTMANAPNVDEAIGLSLNSCVSHFIGNWAAFQEGNRVKAVHQMRVAMRRMRSIIGIFQRSFPCAEFLRFRQWAKEIATALGEARNWDVFIDLIRNGPLAIFPGEPGFGPLLIDAQMRQEDGYTVASEMLAAPETSRFVLALQSFIGSRGWRNGPSGQNLPSLTAPADVFFSENLARIHRNILKSGRSFDRMTPHHRHELRKDLKKIRYLVELFGDLFELQRENKKYIRVVSLLQDQLGIFNDLSAAEEMIAKLNSGGEPAAIRAIGIMIGWCGRGATADDSSLRGAWKRFRKLEAIA